MCTTLLYMSHIVDASICILCHFYLLSSKTWAHLVSTPLRTFATRCIAEPEISLSSWFLLACVNYSDLFLRGCAWPRQWKLWLRSWVLHMKADHFWMERQLQWNVFLSWRNFLQSFDSGSLIGKLSDRCQEGHLISVYFAYIIFSQYGKQHCSGQKLAIFSLQSKKYSVLRCFGNVLGWLFKQGGTISVYLFRFPFSGKLEWGEGRGGLNWHCRILSCDVLEILFHPSWMRLSKCCSRRRGLWRKCLSKEASSTKKQL